MLYASYWMSGERANGDMVHFRLLGRVFHRTNWCDCGGDPTHDSGGLAVTLRAMGRILMARGAGAPGRALVSLRQGCAAGGGYEIGEILAWAICLTPSFHGRLLPPQFGVWVPWF